MKLILCASLALVIAVIPAAAAPAPDQPELDARVQQFFAAKERQGRQLTDQLRLEVAEEVWDFFEAGAKGDWEGVEELYKDLAARSGQYSYGQMDPAVRTVVWQTVNEAYGLYAAFSQMNAKFVDAFGRGIIDSIPRGSIYFGGTDPGRWIVTGLSKSHEGADPFFTLTQNALAAGDYLEYLRVMYGKRINVPTQADGKAAFEEYAVEARERQKAGQLKPGEKFSEVNGQVSMSGVVTVMAINAIVARKIFDDNPDREFFIEESQPLDWMYPYLSPHGFILKINRTPPTELPEAVLREDTRFWRKQTSQWIGDWLKEGTPVKAVNEFAERIYLRRDFKDFKGDQAFVTADRRYSPQKIFGRLRATQAAVYAWRAEHAVSAAERTRMRRAADFAFRQAFALGAFSSDATLRYANWLKQEKRLEEARLVAATSVKLGSGHSGLQRLAEDLETK